MTDDVQDNPYAAPSARVADLVDGDAPKLAERGTRLGAKFLDGLVFGIVYIPIIIGASMMAPGPNGASKGGNPAIVVMMGVASLVVLGLVIYNFILLHRNGQTIGKKLLGIRIVRSDGARVGLLRVVFIRALPVTLLGMIPLIGPLFSLLDPLLIFRDNRRCLHDQIADTVVVIA